MEHIQKKQKIRNDKYMGANIARIRKSTGLKQDQVVAQMQILGSEISRTSYSKLEQGLRHIQPKQLKMLRSIFDVEYDAFFEELEY